MYEGKVTTGYSGGFDEDGGESATFTPTKTLTF